MKSSELEEAKIDDARIAAAQRLWECGERELAMSILEEGGLMVFDMELDNKE